MNTHPYLRAFMAGTLVPTLVLPLLLTAFLVLRVGMQVSFPIERGLIFPMALVPALWGLWNILWQLSRERTHLALGAHGALLPPLMIPVGAAIGIHGGVLTLGTASVTWFSAVTVPYALIALFLGVGMTAYYLAWKYVVGFVNRLLGIA
ncbi:hypothetical protein [Occallatibacter savannae]|uniref:hypothetical protein n=1 Tax=Occallatibacter savannae TaxID=1002691 RepID=UPI000D699714|nr:hypothetical protein [Occallatibacter savannae]